MRFSHISLIAVMLVVIAVALAGCSGSSPAAPSRGSYPGSRDITWIVIIRSSGCQAAAVSGSRPVRRPEL